MATGKITKRSVDAASVGFLWDDEVRGFGLRVTEAGAKSYIYQYRMGGREAPAKRFTIGKHGSPWTPATARAEAIRLSTLRGQRVDPREAEKEFRRQAVDLAFGPYANNFLDRCIKEQWPKSYAFAEGILRLHITPVLQSRTLPSLTRSDVAAVLDRLPPGKVALRRNVYAVLRRLIRWAVSRGDLESSPIEGFEPPTTATSRDRVLSHNELAVVWSASRALGHPFGPFFRLLIITGQRREEVGGLKWEELTRAEGRWLLDASRSKNGVAHVVPLSCLAIAELDLIAGGKKWPLAGFVFTTTGKTSVSGYSRAKRNLDAMIARQVAKIGDGRPDIKPWRVHDLRRTFATCLQRLNVRFEVIEALLNHLGGSRSGIAAVYQRHDWAEEKRAAMADWASRIRELVAELPAVAPEAAVVENVVAFRSNGRTIAA